MQPFAASIHTTRPAPAATGFSFPRNNAAGGRLPKKRARRANRAKGQSEIIAHTLERSSHGPVERLEKPISDTEGRIVRPFRAVDTLAAMQRRGSITPEMRQAGETFRERFRVAHHDPLHAAPLVYTPKSAGSVELPGFRIQAAKDHVWRAICAVGGLISHPGSCLWNVVGLEQTIKQWSLEHGFAQETASGILIAGLSMLEAHYNGPRNK